MWVSKFFSHVRGFVGRVNIEHGLDSGRDSEKCSGSVLRIHSAQQGKLYSLPVNYFLDCSHQVSFISLFLCSTRVPP
jgi:hypothetical protein